MLSSTSPDDIAEEKGYYPVGGCGGNIEWHTEDDLIHIVDEEILMNDMKVYLLSVLRNVNANILPYDFTHTIQDHMRSEEHTSELQSRGHLVCRLLLEKKREHTRFI